MSNEQRFLYRSKKDPSKSISIGRREDGTLFIFGVAEQILKDDNVFESIEEIERLIKDDLEMITNVPPPQQSN